MFSFLDFEKPIAELEGKLEELRHLSSSSMNITNEVERLEQKVEKLLTQIYAKLSPAEKMQVARHANRPHTLDYIEKLITDFTPLAGDRLFGEDEAIVGGLGRFKGISVVVMGQERGHDTESRMKHNFGMASPEGYRKAIRLMEMADQFKLPILTFVDTAGAYPGIEAEERGQAEAIARSMQKMLQVKVPVISTIIGEGGSGGAIAIATANHVLMLEHAIYSVISPEGCASILWRDAAKSKDAAAALRLTAQDLKKLEIIDDIVPEPVGGAHRQPEVMISQLGLSIEKALKQYLDQDGARLKTHRSEKFLAMGQKGL